MRYLDWLDRMDIELTLEQHIACAFLEGRGKEFMTHFGVDNCVELAQVEMAIVDKERDRKSRPFIMLGPPEVYKVRHVVKHRVLAKPRDPGI